MRVGPNQENLKLAISTVPGAMNWFARFSSQTRPSSVLKAPGQREASPR